MFHALPILMAAIELSRPGIPKAEAARYAEALNQIGRETSIDPLVAVAIIHFESHWFPSLISDDGEDYGLGQVRARFMGACRDDEDPLNAPSEACKSAKMTLLDGVTNIRRMGSVIAANKAFCKEKVGSDHERHWLAGYQGYGDVRHWCKPGEKTSQVLDYYGTLVDKLLPKKKATLAKNAHPAAPGAKAQVKVALAAPAKGSKTAAKEPTAPAKAAAKDAAKAPAAAAKAPRVTAAKADPKHAPRR